MIAEKLTMPANNAIRLCEAPPSCVASIDYLNADLERRHIDKEWGMFEVLPPKLLALDSTFYVGGDDHRSACFKILTHDADGSPRPELSRTRYDTKHKDMRYHNPRGTGSIIYSPLPDSFAAFEAAQEKYIGEGEFKTMSLIGAGCVALGIGGVWNWRREGKLHPDLASRIQPGDKIHLCIDGDWKTNIDVHKGTYLLMQALRDAGASPLLVDLPTGTDDQKVGVDDLIAEWRRLGKDVPRALAALKRLEAINNPFAVDLSNPAATAANFLASQYPDGTLVRWGNLFYRWKGMGWIPADGREECIRAELYQFILDNGGNPKQAQVTNVVDALRALTHFTVPSIPAWRTPVESDADKLFSVSNGLLDLETRRLIPHSPAYFNLSWSNVEFDAKATCLHWLEFLGQVYPGDPDAQQLLQEWLGYCISNDTSQQKMLMMVGVKRSGKGTIARIARELVGEDSFCAPTLSGLGDKFGLSALIGKKLAVVSDARISSKHDTQASVENMLRISGEDSVTVDRKFIGHWNGRLPTRLWVITNLLPGMLDEGGALASRFLILSHAKSFFGREDSGLTARLLEELPGILNWALAGLRRLWKRGHFVQPASGHDRLRDLARINSPIKGFVEDRCTVAAGEWVKKDDLYNAFNAWQSSNGRTMQMHKEQFTQALFAATDEVVKATRKRIEEKQVQIYSGIALVVQRVQGVQG